MDDIARNLRTANESVAKQTRVVLRAGEKDGTVDAVAKVSDSRPLRFSVSLDSTGTPSTSRTPWRASRMRMGSVGPGRGDG